jgi:copper chaperone
MIEFTLPTMTCGHCVKTVTQVSIDLTAHTLHIESSQPAPVFAAALTEEGYSPA